MTKSILQYIVLALIILPLVLILIGHKSMAFLWEDTYQKK